MVTYRALGSVAEAVARLLEQAWDATILNGIEPQLEVYQGTSFSAPMQTGLSVFVHRVSVDSVQRTLPRSLAHHRPPLPVVLDLLLTAWARDVSAELDLLGWAMRTLADHPIVSTGFLIAAVPGVFAGDETVELVSTDLSGDQIFQLWQALPGQGVQLSASYAARVVRLESEIVDPVAPPVLTRVLAMAEAGSRPRPSSRPCSTGRRWRSGRATPPPANRSPTACWPRSGRPTAAAGAGWPSGRPCPRCPGSVTCPVSPDSSAWAGRARPCRPGRRGPAGPSSSC